MPWIGPAIQAGGSILGGIMGGNAAGDASKAMQEAQTYNQMVSQYQKNAAGQQAAPYTNLGRASTSRLSQLLGLGNNGYDMRVLPDGSTVYDKAYSQAASEFAERHPGGNITQADPGIIQDYVNGFQKRIAAQNGLGEDAGGADSGSLLRSFTEADLAKDVPYNKGLQFGLDQGTSAINARAIQNGGYDSGATLKALTRFGNDYGETKAAGAQQRFMGDKQSVYGMLSGQSGQGLNAAGANINAGNTATGQMIDASNNNANALAAGTVGRANATANAFGGIGTAIQGYQSNQILQKILAQRNGNWAGGNGGTGGISGSSYGTEWSE